MALFVQAMLSKVKSWTISCINTQDIVDETLKTIWGDTTNYSFGTIFTNSYWTILRATITLVAFWKAMANDKDCNLSVKYRRGTSWDGTFLSASRQRSDNTEMAYNWDNNNTQYDKTIVITETNLASNEVLQLCPRGWKSYLYQRKLIASISYNYTIQAPTGLIKSLPRQLKDIGKKATATLFGIHIDNTRYTGE